MTGTNACGWGAHRKWFQTIASPGKSPVIDLDLGFGQDADAWHFDDKVPPPLQVGSWIARGFASHQASHVRVDRARSFVCIPRQDVKNCTSFSSWNMFFPSARQVLFGPSGFTIAGDPLDLLAAIRFSRWWIAHAHTISHWRIKHGES